MNNRRKEALRMRQECAQLAHDRIHPDHIANGEEQKFRHNEKTCKQHKEAKTNAPAYLMTFTKGLPHNIETGLVDKPHNVQLLIQGIDSGDPRDFRDTPLGDERNINGAKCHSSELVWHSEKAKNAIALKDKCGNPITKNGKPVMGPVDVRAWESQSAGLAFDLEGPDAQAVTMPPAPILGGAELTAEMAEVYGQALLRDVPFNAMSAGLSCDNAPADIVDQLKTKAKDVQDVKDITDKITGLDWFNQSPSSMKLNPAEAARQRCFPQTPSSAFRGITYGDDIGPYISQFLLAGNKGINKNDNDRNPSDGFISYGAVRLSQQVRTAKAGKDHLTHWEEWLDAQDGADLRNLETYVNQPQDRFIFTPRDLATYVHYDALYQSYLSACLLLLGNGVPFDPGIPFQRGDNMDHQQGFAHFGGPHILSLVTEVATRALKAVRYQKYNVHRRCRPEVVAGRLEKLAILQEIAPGLDKLENDLGSNGIDLLSSIKVHNKKQNSGVKPGIKKETVLLPMAFCEGSPMHPSYGAGHATVAGACVTILKAFFDHDHPLDATGEGANTAFVSTTNGNKLEIVPVMDQKCNPAQLTVHGELNKLASNISIGRNWAGVHYFSDYYESLLMGEKIAIGILEEQRLTYKENFSMTIPLFGGGTRRI